MSLKVAVVGVGYLGQHHARVYSELEGVELVGVADRDGERAKDAASRYGTKAYLDYRDLLNDVDAVSVVVPTTDHLGVSLDCIRAGKDLLVEKPITATVTEADELIGETTRRNLILQVGHIERYNPGVAVLSRMAEEPEYMEAVRVSPFLNRACDVDVTIDLMIHDIDIVLSLVSSPIKNISAYGFSLVTEKIDEARVLLEFENGSAASLTASRISKEKKRSLKVFQKNSVIELDYQTGVIELRSSSAPFVPEIVRPEYREPLKEELKDFVRCVERRERPKVSGVEGRNALSVATAIGSLMERRR